MTAAATLQGKSFGHLSVIGRAQAAPSRVLWDCRCVCGASLQAYTVTLTSGDKKSCGCGGIREQLRDIPGYEKLYAATADGRIWSFFSAKFVESAKRRDGYLYVMLRKEGRSINEAVHRLVAAAWIRAPQDGEQVNHKNLVKTDNAVGNLEWVTPSENFRHAWTNLPAETVAHLKRRRAAGAITMNRQKRKLSTADVARAREFVAAGKSHTATAALLGCCRTTIDNIMSGATYRD